MGENTVGRAGGKCHQVRRDLRCNRCGSEAVGQCHTHLVSTVQSDSYQHCSALVARWSNFRCLESGESY